MFIKHNNDDGDDVDDLVHYYVIVEKNIRN